MDDDTRADLANALTTGILQVIGADPVTAGLGGAALAYATRLDAARWERAGRTLTRTAHEVGGSDRLIALAESDPARQELTLRVIEAGARTVLEEKIEGLAKVLAQGLTDDTVDEALILAAALQDLEAPHVQLLLDMAQHPHPNALFDPEPEEGREYERGWHLGHVQRRGRLAPALALPVMTVLERHALVEPAHGGRYVRVVVEAPRQDRDDRWEVSAFGLELLKLLGFEVVD